MEKAIEKCDDATVELYQVMTKSYQQLRESHDHILVTKGPTWTTILAEERRYRTKDVPFSKKLLKNKRYKKSHNDTSKGSSNNFVQMMKIAWDFDPDEGFGNKKIGLKYQANLNDLCRNGDYHWRTMKFNSHLKCHFLNMGNPYLLIGPFKMEEKSDNPFLVIFHDFLSKKETSLFRSVKKESLETSEAKNVKIGTYRKSKQMWINDVPTTVFTNPDTDPRIVRKGKEVSRRIEHATKLQLLQYTSAEGYQGTFCTH